MMRTFALSLAALVASAAAAPAQFGQPNAFGQPASPFYQPPVAQPNVYNPVNQPLSPYLNLLRGGNAGVNYYYGVRPGTAGGTGFGLGLPFASAGAQRALFFPQLQAPSDPQALEAGEGSVIRPAGHPVVYNNTLGYFPSPFGNRGGSRGGLTGLGNRPTAAAQQGTRR